ncbi:MAG TPA: class I SAM-dependent methyltransferase [Longilinea sp.]|nr:class I SAM-dependent methyltransferase [Longilinea sp.]
MHERRFKGDPSRLRSPERVARMEVERVVTLCLQGTPAVHTVLDIGTGSALFAEEFAKRELKVGGVDANQEMVASARQYVPDGDFRQGEAEHLPFPDATFDMAFMGVLLHETDDTLQALNEAHRVVTQRLMVLEWPYEVQDFGPGLEERLSEERLADLARQAHFKPPTSIRLKNVILYRLEK